MEKTIVIIDDEPVTLKILEKYFTEAVYNVFTADNGTTGYDLVVREKPDILICDMLLPGIHGVEICKKIKMDPELDHTKVIMMTSVYNNSRFTSHDLDCDHDGFLKKPIDINELKQVIANL